MLFPVFSFCKIEALKSFSKLDLVSWFKAHRGPGSKMLSVHVSVANHLKSCSHLAGKFLNRLFGLSQVVGYGKYELEEDSTRSCEDPSSREGMRLIYLPPSPLLADSTIPITDIRAFTSTLSLFPYHKIVK